jgi:hypothetical protein
LNGTYTKKLVTVPEGVVTKKIKNKIALLVSFGWNLRICKESQNIQDSRWELSFEHES